jgi:hypothetical protein
MCYINCMLEMMQIMKKGKMNFQAAIKQVDALIPSDLKVKFSLYSIRFEFVLHYTVPTG